MSEKHISLGETGERQEISYLSFSGGRSSAYMLRIMLDSNYPFDYIIFANTGLESPETYEFIKAINDEWLDGTLIVLEYKGNNVVESVSVEKMARKGEPFMELVLRDGKSMPSMNSRICTHEMKVKGVLSWLYEKYDYKHTNFNSYLGLRADELRRVSKLNTNNAAYEERDLRGLHPLKWSQLKYAPLHEKSIRQDTVLKYFQGRPLKAIQFDISRPDVRLSNCVGCFFSNVAEKVRVARQQPEYAEWWDNLERKWYEIQKARGGLKAVNPKRQEWAMKYLGRRLDEDSFEAKAYTASFDYTWSMIIEYAKKQQLEQGVLPIVDLTDPRAGGCGDAHCGTDI